MSHRHIMLTQCLAVMSACLKQQAMGRLEIRNPALNKTDWNVETSAMSQSTKQGYRPEPKLHGAASQKRAAKKAKNKKRGRK